MSEKSHRECAAEGGSRPVPLILNHSAAARTLLGALLGMWVCREGHVSPTPEFPELSLYSFPSSQGRGSLSALLQ